MFVAGALIVNRIPHVVAGLQGTPLAKPRDLETSSPLTNLLPGAANLLIGGEG